MSDALHELSSQADQVHAEYRRHFAGRSRYTRDLALLEGLLDQTRQLLARAEGVDGAQADLLPALRERATLYATERDRIAEIRAGGADEIAAHRAHLWTQLAQARYARCFAGQARTTRDVGLLEELVADQRRWRDQVRALAARHEPGWHQPELQQMDGQVTLFEGELPRIRKARQDLQPRQRAQVMATLANEQFAVWRRHFQDRKRSTRRPGLLQRMISNLESVHAEMILCRKQGVSEAFNLGNIDNLGKRLPAWRDELARIEAARAQVGPDEIAGGLGEEANSWFERFRADFAGRPRETRDLAALHEICEGLQEVARAMEDLDRTWRRELNLRNLDIVLENLKGYEREHEAIRQAQRGGQASP